MEAEIKFLRENNCNQIKVKEPGRPKKYEGKISEAQAKKLKEFSLKKKSKKKSEEIKISPESSLIKQADITIPPGENTFIVVTNEQIIGTLQKTTILSPEENNSITVTCTSITSPIMTTSVLLPIPVIPVKFKKSSEKVRKILMKPRLVKRKIINGKFPIPALKRVEIIKKLRAKRKIGNKKKSQEEVIKVEENTKILKIEIPKEIPEIKEIPETSELSNDIFASLQVPPSHSNQESLSPTAAFLMAFPKPVGKNTDVMEEEVIEETPKENLLDNFSTFFSTKEYSEYLPDPVLLEKKIIEKIPEKEIPVVTTISEEIKTSCVYLKPSFKFPEKVKDLYVPVTSEITNYSYDNFNFDLQAPAVKPYYTNVTKPVDTPPILKSAEFTFSLTSTTNSLVTSTTSTLRTNNFYNPLTLGSQKERNVYQKSMEKTSSSLTKPTLDPPYLPRSSYQIQSSGCSVSNFGNTTSCPQTSFTFSLTNPTASAQKTVNATFQNSTNKPTIPFTFVPTSYVNSDPYNNYNPFTFDNNFMISEKSINFTFSLTTSASKVQPKYTTTSTTNSTYNTFNPFSIDSNLPQNSGIVYDSGHHNFSKPSCSNLLKTPKKLNQFNELPDYIAPAVPALPQYKTNKTPPKKNTNSQNQKYHVNWMTSPDFKQSVTEFPILPSTLEAPPPPPPAPPTSFYQNLDINRKSDIFFAHPPGDDNYPWSPNKMSNILDGSNIYIPSTLPTLHGELGLSTPANSDVNKKIYKNYTELPENSSNNNFFSVSNLVEDNGRNYQNRNSSEYPQPSAKKLKVDKTKKEVINKRKSWNSNFVPEPIHGYQDVNKGVSSNTYSAEALIGNGSKKTILPQDSNYYSMDLSTDPNYSPYNHYSSSQNCNPFMPEIDNIGSTSYQSDLNKQYSFNKPPDNSFVLFPPKPSSSGNYQQKQPFQRGSTTSTPKKNNIGNYDTAPTPFYQVPGIVAPEDPYNFHHLNYKNIPPTYQNQNNVTQMGSASIPGNNIQNPTGSLTNFNLSTICPEINDKVRQQNW